MAAGLQGAPLEAGHEAAVDSFAAWAERSGTRLLAQRCNGGLRFAFMGGCRRRIIKIR